jgi:hypothetical protein
MTFAEKRALLARWASDAHAVENAPALRQLDDGSVVELGEILRVLRSLDGEHRRTETPRRTFRAEAVQAST